MYESNTYTPFVNLFIFTLIILRNILIFELSNCQFKYYIQCNSPKDSFDIFSKCSALSLVKTTSIECNTDTVIILYSYRKIYCNIEPQLLRNCGKEALSMRSLRLSMNNNGNIR